MSLVNPLWIDYHYMIYHPTVMYLLYNNLNEVI